MNWRYIKDMIIDLYEYEGDLVFNARQDGVKVVRLTSVLLIVIALFYCLSPIDIISEAIVVPRFMGYIDDMIVCILVGALVYSDVKGALKFEDTGEGTEREVFDGEASSKSERHGEDNVLREDRPIRNYSNNISANAVDSTADSEGFQDDYARANRSVDDIINSDSDEFDEGDYDYEDETDLSKLLH